MESLSPITLRKALGELALPERERQARDNGTGRGVRVWIVVMVVAALGAACAFSVWR